MSDPTPYDALLLVSFGGPEKPEDVVPFLENVTTGRGIPRERLEEVGEHYFRFGGRSPLNDLNREFLAAVREDFAGAGLDLPVYWGNRNWDPYLTEAMEEMRADGVRRVLCLLTSAYSSYSGCRQYRENLADAVVATGGDADRDADGDADGDLRLDRIRHYFNHPGFVETMVDATLNALSQLPAASRNEAHLLFVTHSIPDTMDEASGLGEVPGTGLGGHAYVQQHQSVVDLVVERLRSQTGHRFPGELTYCSRSGPPSVPWLEPDVGDRIHELAAEGVTAVVVVPIGFVADHMEVIYDLDVEAAEAAEEAGVAFVRAATAGVDPRFVTMVRRLVLERAAVERGESVERPALGTLGASWDVCPPGCCANARRPGRPALCGSDPS